MGIVETDEASAFDVERVNIIFTTLLSLADILQGSLDVAMLEVAPS